MYVTTIHGHSEARIRRAMAALAIAAFLGFGTAHAQEKAVWEIVNKDGVVERLDPPELGAPVDVAFEPVEVRSEVVGGGPGKRIEVEQVVSDGMGGRVVTGSFGAGLDRMLEDPHGHIWASCGGICRFDGQQWQQFTTEDGLLHRSVFGMALSPGGHLWVATRGGVTQFDGERWIQHRLGIEMRVGIGVAPDGTVWAGGYRDTEDLDEYFLRRQDRVGFCNPL